MLFEINMREISIDRLTGAWNLFFWFFSINIVLFTWQAANPLPMQDSWYFIDTFVRKAITRSLEITDFFHKRDAKDHAQPLHKLMLYAHVKLFSLDFMFDAIVSVMAGLLMFRFLAYWLTKNLGQHACYANGQVKAGVACLRFLILVALPFSLLSMNNIEVYTWPLVGQFFITFPFILWYLLAFGRALERQLLGYNLLLSTVSVVFLLDTLGMLCLASSLAYCMLLFACKSVGNRFLAKLIALTMGVALVVKWAVLKLIPSFAGSSATVSVLSAGFAYVLENWRDMGFWLIIPATSSVMHQHWLRMVNDSFNAALISLVLGIVVLMLHFWFWKTWWSLQKNNITTVAAVLMLYVYLNFIAILLIRLPDFGLDYLNQGRYVPFCYQISVLALLIQLWNYLNEQNSGLGLPRSSCAAIGLVLAVYLGLQVGYVWKSWDKINATRKQRNVQAEEMLRFKAISASQGMFKSWELNNFAGYDNKSRTEIIDLLVKNNLSIYSKRFQYRYNWQDFLQK